MPPPVPVTVVAGFLGSGKTTLLNRVLSEDHGRVIAVIVNELGEIGLDGELLEGGEGFVQLDNGCLCCALNEDLVVTLGELGARERLDQVFIETTGIADPWPVARAVERPELAERFALDAVVVTVDALNFRSSIERHPEVALQIKRADFALVTKLDLVSEAEHGELTALVERLNPAVRPLRADEPSALAVLLAPDPERARRGDVGDAPAHARGAHGYRTVSVDVGNRATIRLCFEDFLESLPESVYRAKGIVKIDGEPGRLVFHAVGRRRDLVQDERRGGPGRLVFIGRDLDEAALKDEVTSLFEEA